MSELDPDSFSILMTVAGVSYRQDAISRCSEGQAVQLIRDPSNEHDQNAIEVHAGEHIGFIPKDEAEFLALYLDFCGRESVEATIDSMTGGTDEKPTIGVVIEIKLSEALFNTIEDDPDFIRNQIVTDKRMERIEASLTDEDVRKYTENIDDSTLDFKYWSEKQRKWEDENKEKTKKRLGRELENYEDEEIEEEAERKFEKYREKHEVGSFDREKIRKSLTRRDVVFSILSDQDMEEIDQEIKEKLDEESRKENSQLIMGLVIVVVIIILVIAIASG